MSKRSSEQAGLSEAQKARYDRQIRVWGAEAQERIQSARVLLCGLRGLNAEAAKNIVLAGMSVCVQDSGKVTRGDLSSSGYFIQNCDEGKDMVDAALPRIQELNTFAKVSGEKKTLNELDDDFYLGFSVICIADASEDDVCRISDICRSKSNDSIIMMASWAYGQEGMFISDFGSNFQYKEDERPNYVPTVQTMAFPSIKDVLQIQWNKMQKGKFLPLSSVYVKAGILSKWKNIQTKNEQHVTAKIALEQNGIADDYFTESDLNALQRVSAISSATVVSILGSFLAQEIVKGVSKIGEPAFNTHIFTRGLNSVQVYPMNETMTAPANKAQVATVQKFVEL
jgi:molybdopterin/thiamine biosynthesis adenylyltransferase